MLSYISEKIIKESELMKILLDKMQNYKNISNQFILRKKNFVLLMMKF